MPLVGGWTKKIIFRGAVWRRWMGLQVFCIFLFLTAVSLFGTLISQLNEIVAKQTSQTKELDSNLELYLDIKPRSVFGSENCRPVDDAMAVFGITKLSPMSGCLLTSSSSF